MLPRNVRQAAKFASFQLVARVFVAPSFANDVKRVHLGGTLRGVERSGRNSTTPCHTRDFGIRDRIIPDAPPASKRPCESTTCKAFFFAQVPRGGAAWLGDRLGCTASAPGSTSFACSCPRAQRPQIEQAYARRLERGSVPITQTTAAILDPATSDHTPSEGSLSGTHLQSPPSDDRRPARLRRLLTTRDREGMHRRARCRRRVRLPERPLSKRACEHYAPEA